MNPKAYTTFKLPIGVPGTCGMIIGLNIQKTAIERLLRKATDGRVDCSNEEQMLAAFVEVFEGVLADVTFGLFMQQEGPKIQAPPPGFVPPRNIGS